MCLCVRVCECASHKQVDIKEYKVSNPCLLTFNPPPVQMFIAGGLKHEAFFREVDFIQALF